jgi:PucR C-terminal helix-turn-helix domain/GGDEF-like domain
MCHNPQMDMDGPAVAGLMASVAAAVSRRVAAVSENVYEVTLREIPELHDDQAVLALFASSIHSNVGTCLQIMQHQIDLAAVRAPAASLEYARRRAQRGTPLTALLRTYRLGHTVFSGWVFRELAQQTSDVQLLTAVTLDMTQIVAGYVDQTSEEIVAAYAQEREHWLRNRSAARAARIRDLLSGRRVNVSAAEATLGYRLRQFHVGVVCWADDAGKGDEAGVVDNVTRLERAVGHIAAKTACGPDLVFQPRDESSAWAWLPLGIRDQFDTTAASTADLDDDLHVAFGEAVKGVAGFRVTHQQAVAAQAVALAGRSAVRVVTYREVAPVAMMLGTTDLLRVWVLSTLGELAADDEHHARLRDTLLVFLDTGGSYKTTAERLVLHKNTVQYRIRKAEESLGRPVGESRHDVELALRASHWLGPAVLQPAAAPAAAGRHPVPRPRTS